VVTPAHDLNDLDSRISNRGYFERVLVEREKKDDERDRRLDERFAAQEKAIGKAESKLDSTLSGFPQEYSRKAEMEQMRLDLANTATVLAEKVADSARALATAQDKVTERQDIRLASLEKFQFKLLGLALAIPFVTAITAYLLAK